MFNRLAKFDERRSKLIIAGTIVFVILSAVFGSGVISHLKQGGYADKKSQSFQVQQELEQKLGKQPGLIVLFSSPDKEVTDPAIRQEVERVLGSVAKEPSVTSVASYYSTSSPDLVSFDKKSTYAAITVKGDLDQQLKEAEHLKAKLTSDQIKVQVGGQLAIQNELSDQVSEDLEHAEMLSFPLLAILLVLVFRSFVAALLPLLLGAVTIVGAFLVLRLITQFTDLSIFALNIITILGLGLSIDYSLFIVSRFREELRNFKGDKAKAIERTLKTAGRTVFFSGVTVMVSLLGLLVFPLNFLQSMGIGGSAAVLVAMVMALTFLPAILYLLGNRVNGLSFGSAKRDNQSFKAGKLKESKTSTTFWHNIPRFVMRHAGLMIAVTVVPLILAGLPFLRAEFNVPDYRSLPSEKESRQVSEVLKTKFPNTSDPIEVVVQTPSNVLEEQNISSLYNYVQELKKVPGVTKVDSLVTTRPDLSKQDYIGLFAKPQSNPELAALASQYAKDNYTVVNLRYEAPSGSDEARKIVRDVRAVQPPQGLQAKVGGVPAQLEDLLTVLKRYTPYGLAFIVITLFVLLFLMLGSVIIPIKAVLMNILSLSASFGALVWIFQDGHLSEWLGFSSIGSIDATQPILIFAIAFGLSMDYAVFLLSRIKEQYDATQDTDKSIALGVEKTGPIITSAALLLLVVIVAFSTSKIPLMKQIGVGLGLAVFIDAVIIRMILVPASMHLLGRYNWWAPAPLKRLQKRLNLSD
jgi:uncharacterized membrane protein YdfJ with MMPL/SSD domain